MEGNFFERWGSVHATAGNLPHWHQTGKITFVTFRLGDSIPQSVMDEIFLEHERKLHDNQGSMDAETLRILQWEKYNRIEKYLDKGHGSCLLSNAECRRIVSDALLYFDGVRCYVHSFVIMPNHVHVLMEPCGEWMLQDIMKSVKHYSALQINRLLQCGGNVWQKESFDRIVRDEQHYMNLLQYINNNPKNLSLDAYTLYFADFL